MMNLDLIRRRRSLNIHCQGRSELNDIKHLQNRYETSIRRSRQNSYCSYHDANTQRYFKSPTKLRQLQKISQKRFSSQFLSKSERSAKMCIDIILKAKTQPSQEELNPYFRKKFKRKPIKLKFKNCGVQTEKERQISGNKVLQNPQFEQKGIQVGKKSIQLIKLNQIKIFPTQKISVKTQTKQGQYIFRSSLNYQYDTQQKKLFRQSINHQNFNQFLIEKRESILNKN